MRKAWILGWLLALLVTFRASERLAHADRVDDLIRQLRNENDFKVRLSAGLNLGKIGDKRAVGPLTDALRDSDKTVRGVAAAALGKIVDGTVPAKQRNDAISALEKVSKSDPDSFVRGQAAKSYAALKSLRSAPGGKQVYVEVGPMADNSKKGGPAVIAAMRGTVTKTIIAKNTSFITSWPSGKSPSKGELSKAGTKGAFYVDGTLTSLEVKKTGSLAEVSCNVSLYIATFPDKSMFGFLKGGAQVQTASSDRAVDEAKADCVSAVLEDIVARQVVPAIQQRAL